MKRNRFSRTAKVVAMSQALVGRTPETCDLVDPEALRFAEATLRQVGSGWFRSGLKSRAFRWLVRCCEATMIPGLALHHVLRKRFLEELVRGELQAGAGQVVQIGAGFDSLAFRLHREFGEVRFVEIDHPATQRVKSEVIAARGGVGENLELRPQDLSQAGVVIGEEWHEANRTVVIVEGVLMYLSRSEVVRFVRSLRRTCSAADRFLFSFMTASRFERQSILVGGWLRMAGEPMRWAIRAEEIAGFLAPLGFSVEQVCSAVEGGGADWQAGPAAEGELVCVASPMETESPSVKRAKGVMSI